MGTDLCDSVRSASGFADISGSDGRAGNRWLEYLIVDNAQSVLPLHSPCFRNELTFSGLTT